MSVRVRVTMKTSGPTLDDHRKKIEQDFISAVGADLKATPSQFSDPPGRRGRKFGRPYQRTGTLVDGIHFKPAAGSTKRGGVLGSWRAPASRLAFKAMKAGFLRRVHQVLDLLGGWGWAKRGRGA